MKPLGSLCNLTKTMMKKYSLAFFVLLIIGSLFHNLKASHYTSGEIFYKYIGDSTGVANQYEIFVKLYRTLSGTTMQTNTSQPLCISSSCYQDSTINLALMVPPASRAHPLSTNGWKLPDFDLCVDTNVAVDISVAKYSGRIILPPCADYKFKLYGQCCRDNLDNLSSSSNTGLFLQANLNNSQGQNSSPQILSPAGRTFCVTQPGQTDVFYPHAVTEKDGDSLVFSLATPKNLASGSSHFNCGPAINIPYTGSFTANSPLPSFTGTTLNPSHGLLSFSPSLTGDYQVKIDINEFRFDTISLQWLNVGKSTRDFSVYITSNCSPQITGGPKLKTDSAITVLNNLLKTEMDSLKSAYGISILKGSDSLGNGSSMITKLPFYHGYTCFDSLLDLNFTSTINYNSLKTTDFRLIGPDGVPRPIVGIKNLNQTSVSSKVQLMLHQPLDLNGNYLLQIRRGSDANTLLNSCGFAVEEFYGALVVVDSCPQPSYNLSYVSVDNNENIRLEWEVDNDFNDPNLLSTFNSWIIHRRDLNDNLMKPIKVIHDPSTRIFIDSFHNNEPNPSSASREYALLLKYNGKRREMTRNCKSIKLNVAPTGPWQSKVFLSWNHYNCLDPLSRVYKVYRGIVDTITNSISWQQLGDMTSHNNLEVNLNSSNPLPAGSYVYKVVAQDQKNNSTQGLSESNWIYFYHVPPTSFSGKNGKKLQIPNIITPNGDQINDRFYIELPTNVSYFTKINLSIYKRNGELLYENKNYQNINNSDSGWNGVNSSGETLSSGVYYYTIEVKTADSNVSEHYQGSITIGG